jgi:hypothetical protein
MQLVDVYSYITAPRDRIPRRGLNFQHPSRPALGVHLPPVRGVYAGRCTKAKTIYEKANAIY